MLLTEEEAKTKACCQTLCADIWTNQRENEGECRTATTPCIGSACMAWRWTEKRDGTPKDEILLPVRGALKLPDPAQGHRWFSGQKDENDMVPWAQFAMRGYCGLAGKVE